jgi:hypothetical protein
MPQRDRQSGAARPPHRCVVRTAYPKASKAIPGKAPYRQSDAIAGGTWEALERILKSAGYFSGGLRKTEAASAIGRQFDPTLARSPSFLAFRNALLEAVASHAKQRGACRCPTTTSLAY